tara:strand:- start:467 stop:808 length:342 start_codon:yes stop_codon:yes gene_type:complete
MKLETYSHTFYGLLPEGLCIKGKNFVAKKRFGSSEVSLTSSHNKNNYIKHLATATYYDETSGIWKTKFNRGYFPEHLDPSSQEARALDRLSHPTLKDHLKVVVPRIENFIYSL